MSKDDTPFTDQLKKAVDELQLESKVKDAVAAAEQAVLRGLDATGSYLRDHRADIEGFLERTSTAIDGQTGGRYADQVEQLRSQLSAGVASIADRQWQPPALDQTAEGHELSASAAADVPPEDRPSPDDDPDSWGETTDQV